MSFSVLPSWWLLVGSVVGLSFGFVVSSLVLLVGFSVGFLLVCWWCVRSRLGGCELPVKPALFPCLCRGRGRGGEDGQGDRAWRRRGQDQGHGRGRGRGRGRGGEATGASRRGRSPTSWPPIGGSRRARSMRAGTRA